MNRPAGVRAAEVAEVAIRRTANRAFEGIIANGMSVYRDLKQVGLAFRKDFKKELASGAIAIEKLRGASFIAEPIRNALTPSCLKCIISDPSQRRL